MDILWLVQWTGNGAIICLRHRAILTRIEDQSTLLLRPVSAWLLNGGILTPAPIAVVEGDELSQALRFSQRKLVRVGSEGGQSIRTFSPKPVYYDLYRAREYWLGSVTELRDTLMRFAGQHLTQ